MADSILTLPLYVTGVPALVPGAPAAARTLIFNATETANPGDPAVFQGEFSSTAQFFMTSPAQTLPLQLANFTDGTNVSQTKRCAIVQIPDSAVKEQYAVWFVDGSVTSKPVYINAPKLKYSKCPEFSAGGQLEFFGRNLVLTPGLGTLYFTPTDASGPTVTCVVSPTRSDAYKIRATAPSNAVPGKYYKVEWSNGYGVAGNRSTLDENLLCLPTGTDYLNIGDRCFTATKYTQLGNIYQLGPGTKDSRLPANCTVNGMGGADDTQAIRNALAYIAGANGTLGGTLKLLAGTYNVSDTLDTPSYCGWWQDADANIVNPTSGGNNRSMFRSTGTTRAAFINPQWISNATTSTVVADIWAPMYAAGSSELLILNGNLDLRESTWINIQDNNRLCWLGTKISQGTAAKLAGIYMQRGPATLANGTRNYVEDLVIRSTIDCMDFNSQKGFVWQRCNMTWDGSLGNRQNTVSHFFAFANCYKIYAHDNVGLAEYNDPNFPKILDPSYKKLGSNPSFGNPANNSGGSANDGEFLISERAGKEGNNVNGFVTSVNGLTLTCNGLNFSPKVSPDDDLITYPTALVITAGTGMGQQRTATSGNGTNITISEAWDVEPDSTSVISTCPWTLDECNLINNTVTNAKRNILIYYAHTRNVVVAGNKAYKSGNIDFAPRYARDGNLQGSGAARVTTNFAPVIVDNVVDGRGDTVNGAGITVHPNAYIQKDPLGCMCFIPQIRRNRVYSDNVNLSVTVDARIEAGMGGYTQYQGNGPAFFDNIDVPIMLGLVADQNLTALSKYGFLVSSGIKLALIRGQRNYACNQGVVNQTLDASNSPARLLVQVDVLTSANQPPAEYEPLTPSIYSALFPEASYRAPKASYSTTPRIYSQPTGTTLPKTYISDGTKVMDPDGWVRFTKQSFLSNATDGVLIIDVSSPVEVSDCNFLGTPYQGFLIIRAPRIIVRNNRCFGSPIPNGQDFSPGYFLDCDNQNSKVQTFLCEQNYVVGCPGIRLQAMDTNTNEFVIRRNDIRNVNSVKGTGGRDFKSAIQLLNCPSIAIDIYQNRIVNEKGIGNGEDQINLYGCVGTDEKRIKVHHNLISGAFSNNLGSGNNNFTGTGTTSDLASGNGLVPAHVHIYKNIYLRTANASCNIAGGHNIYVYHNVGVTFGKFEDGTPIGTQSAFGAIFNYYQTPAADFHDNFICNNKIGYLTWFGDRRDEGDGVPKGSNVIMPDPITLDTEYLYRQYWEQWCAEWSVQDSTFALGNTLTGYGASTYSGSTYAA